MTPQAAKWRRWTEANVLALTEDTMRQAWRQAVVKWTLLKANGQLEAYYADNPLGLVGWAADELVGEHGKGWTRAFSAAFDRFKAIQQEGEK